MEKNREAAFELIRELDDIQSQIETLKNKIFKNYIMTDESHPVVYKINQNKEETFFK